jgi:hypothetical protein
LSNTKRCVTVLGGGIRGTAIAALLAQSQCCKIILLESDRIASGITSTNQGRLHSGAGIWQKGFDAIAYRHRIGSELIRQVTGAVEKQENGIYLIHSSEDVLSLETIWQQYLIPHRSIKASFLNDQWIRESHFAAAYEVPEYAFNPARLAGKFAAYAKSLGADILTKSIVDAIEPRENQRFCIRLTTGEKIDTDIIINALGNCVNHIHSELPLPRLQLEWHQWRVLCLFMPEIVNDVRLNRVITLLENDRSPTAISHNPWITFGCRLTPERVALPTETHVGKWQRFNINHKMDNLLFEVHSRYFLPLQSLSSQEMLKRLFSFSSIYPAFERHRENPFRLLQSDKVPNYYVVYGENATTALLDAVDTIHVVLRQLYPSYPFFSDYVIQLVRKLSVDFTQNTYPDTARMIWENIANHPTFGSDSIGG